MIYNKCEKCQSEWNGIKKLEICPFCGNNIAVKSSNFTKIDEALAFIFDEYGVNVVEENNRLVSLLSDYAPTLVKEKKLIKIALSTSGVCHELMIIKTADEKTRELSEKKIVSKLHNDAFIDPDIARDFVPWFVGKKNVIIHNEVKAEPKASAPAPSPEAPDYISSFLQNSSNGKMHSIGNIQNPFKSAAPPAPKAQNNMSNISPSNVRYSVGDIVKFGTYPFRADGGKEQIEWRIVDIIDNAALLWSAYCIDACPYSGVFNSWERSTLRQWICERFEWHGGNFFTEEEQHSLIRIEIDTSHNPKNNRYCGSKTYDEIFIPSIEDIKKYRLSESELTVKATPYAKSRGAYTVFNDYAFWWLRTPGVEDGNEMFVTSGGVVKEDGCSVTVNHRGVRLALWVNLDNQTVIK